MRRITVVPYDAAWEQSFREIGAVVRNALGELALRIEHVGSTSVQGLAAKPIIDIDVVICERSVLGDVIARLGGTGYRYEGDLGIPGREAFQYEGSEPLPEHHLYVCAQDAAELKRHIAFRDYLRSHPDAVREYGRIKAEGAALFPDDIEKYIEHKAPFIGKVYREIGV